MQKKTVTVQLTLDDSSLYFRDLGEMLSRHVSELCSKGNFAHDFAAGIYRALADQLENGEYDGASFEKLEHLARKGFDETSYGEAGSSVIMNIQTAGFGSQDDDDDVPTLNDAWEIRRCFFESAEGKRIMVILDKFAVEMHGINGRGISVMSEKISPQVEHFHNAQNKLMSIAAERGFMTEPNKSKWKRAASIDEVINKEDEIVFLDDVLSDHRWANLLTRSMKYCVIGASNSEIEAFVEIYKKLPSGFQTIGRIDIDDSFQPWILRLREDLKLSLKSGMFNDDIKKFGNEYGLSELNVPVKQRVELLVETGVAKKGKKRGKVFYTLSSDE